VFRVYNVDMDFAPVYLAYHLAERIFAFIHDWYVDGSRAIARKFINTLERMDRGFAVKITLRHFFQPLYKDYTIVGRVLGVIFRSFRILIGLAVYLVVAAFFALAYVVWVAVPAGLAIYALTIFFQ